MEKSILVFDTPENCEDCPVLLLRPKFNCGEYDWKNNIQNKVKFVCPLKHLPQKKQHEEEIDYDYGYIDGWNECIDEILGEKVKG